jgi:hypothetical protein
MGKAEAEQLQSDVLTRADKELSGLNYLQSKIPSIGANNHRVEQFIQMLENAPGVNRTIQNSDFILNNMADFRKKAEEHIDLLDQTLENENRRLCAAYSDFIDYGLFIPINELDHKTAFKLASLMEMNPIENKIAEAILIVKTTTIDEDPSKFPSRILNVQAAIQYWKDSVSGLKFEKENSLGDYTAETVVSLAADNLAESLSVYSPGRSLTRFFRLMDANKPYNFSDLLEPNGAIMEPLESTYSNMIRLESLVDSYDYLISQPEEGVISKEDFHDLIEKIETSCWQERKILNKIYIDRLWDCVQRNNNPVDPDFRFYSDPKVKNLAPIGQTRMFYTPEVSDFMNLNVNQFRFDYLKARMSAGLPANDFIKAVWS